MKKLPRMSRGKGSGPSYDDSANGATKSEGRGVWGEGKYVDSPTGDWVSE